MLCRKDFYLWLAILPLWAFGRTVSRYSPPLWSRGFHCELIAALVLLIILHHNLWPCGSVLAKAMFTWTKGIRLLSNKLCVRGGGGGRGRGRGDFWGLSAAACRVFVFQLQEKAWGVRGVVAGLNGRNALRWWICKQKRISRNTRTAARTIPPAHHSSCAHVDDIFVMTSPSWGRPPAYIVLFKQQQQYAVQYCYLSACLSAFKNLNCTRATAHHTQSWHALTFCSHFQLAAADCSQNKYSFFLSDTNSCSSTEHEFAPIQCFRTASLAWTTLTKSWVCYSRKLQSWSFQGIFCLLLLSPQMLHQ